MPYADKSKPFAQSLQTVVIVHQYINWSNIPINRVDQATGAEEPSGVEGSAAGVAKSQGQDYKHSTETACEQCGSDPHKFREECRAINQECYYCGKLRHFWKVCRWNPDNWSSKTEGNHIDTEEQSPDYAQSEYTTLIISQMTKQKHQLSASRLQPKPITCTTRTQYTLGHCGWYSLRVPDLSDWLWSWHRSRLQHPTSPQSPATIQSGMTKNSRCTQGVDWGIQWTVCEQSRLMCLTLACWYQSISNHIRSNQHDRTVIEKVHLDDLEVLDMLKMLWFSVVKLAKKFNSTSFNLKQEVFIRRDEDWPEEGWYLYRTLFWHLVDQRWTVNFNIHTYFRGWLISDQCQYRCEVTFAIKSSVMTCSHTLVINFEMKEMTLLNSCQVLKSWPNWI